MRVVIQRVLNSRVTVDGKITGEIGRGFMVLIGVAEGDTEKEADYLAKKTVGLRIFEDENQRMNLSLAEVGGELLIVSQFTLCGACRKGNRPDFTGAAKPDVANRLYEYFIEKCRDLGVQKIETGIFGADMRVDIVNDGPVTLVIDSV